MNFSNIPYIFDTFIRPALDIIALAVIFYQSWQVLVQTQAVQLMQGAFLLVVVYAVASLLNLTTVRWILNALAPGLVIALAIIFQPELRKLFMKLGQQSILRSVKKEGSNQIGIIIQAMQTLAESKRGALIVFSRSVSLKNFMDTGTVLSATVSSSLLVSIFGHDTPLHDGAVIIDKGRIAAAGCFLPLSEQQNIRKSFGTRHRAALGICEETDAITLVVSEETSSLSIAYDSRLYYNLTAAQIERRLSSLLEFNVDIGEEASA